MFANGFSRSRIDAFRTTVTDCSRDLDKINLHFQLINQTNNF